jgi:hypothetical protein
LTGYAWHENRGGNPTTFTTHLLSPDFGSTNYDCGEVAVGDLDGDGDIDPVTYNSYIAYYGADQNLYWFKNDGKASFTRRSLGAAHPTPAVGDLTGDGNPDIVCNFGARAVVYYRNLIAAQPVTVLAPNDASRAFAGGGSLTIRWRADPAAAGRAVTLELWRGTKEQVAWLARATGANGRGEASVKLPRVLSGSRGEGRAWPGRDARPLRGDDPTAQVEP